jgi:hypothetical protein
MNLLTESNSLLKKPMNLAQPTSGSASQEAVMREWRSSHTSC